MLEKRKRFKKNQLILKLVFIKNEIKSIINKSLKKNHFLPPLIRLSYNRTWYNSKEQFFKTYQKLICPFSLSKRVPNKHFWYSRFFLNKKLNNFYINNVYK